jgi:threonine dehydrogenase-like Zn-dependent dehydrogenase
MKIGRGALGLLAVGGLAYLAGHFHVLSAIEPRAWAQAKDQAKQEQINPEMQAMIESGTPGENHKVLNALVGDWAGEWKIYWAPDSEPAVSQGTVKRDWILGGRYLHEAVEATGEMGTFHGVGYSAYNNIDGLYEFIWMDTMSTGIYFETGTFNPETKILTTRNSHRDPATGKVIPGWGKLDLSNPNRHTFVGYSTGTNGKEHKSFEGVLNRVVKN